MNTKSCIKQFSSTAGATMQITGNFNYQQAYSTFKPTHFITKRCHFA